MRLGSRQLVQLLAVIGTSLLLTNCKALPEDVLAKDATNNCFTQLYPGQIVQNQLQGIFFQNGACLGEYKALNKISFQESVLISEDSFALAGTESKVTLNNGAVFVQAANGVKRIGIIDPNSFAIQTDPGVEFALMISDPVGNVQEWSLGQNQSTPVQSERIVIRIPY